MVPASGSPAPSAAAARDRGSGMAAPALTLQALEDIPLIRPGDDLGAILTAALERTGKPLADQDVLVVAQKIVSKAEGRYVELKDVVPTPRAVSLAAMVAK